MKPKLKLNQISDLHDARYCAAVGIDLIGFELEPSNELHVTPKAVGVIMDWLSGPAAVGNFDTTSPEVIQEMVAIAKLTWVSLPLGYPQGQAESIQAKLIFRGPAEPINAEGIAHIINLSEQFADALFELRIDLQDESTWNQLKESQLLTRVILHFSEPSPIYTLLEEKEQLPMAFSLGAFVVEPDGALDYEVCDDFLERVSDLIPA
ncbi:MAG TPA: hypothetical protein ENJ82_04510 [Bacteroidetes bacterium]|nr:hypothetical protein [Bacteroidota bacterium]